MNWYKKAKLDEDSLELLEMSGYQLIEEDFFDNYELYLFKAVPMLEQMLIENDIPIYQIGFQRADTKFMDLEQQDRKNPPPTSDVPFKSGMEWIKSTIEGWTQQYGPIVAMSHSEEKNRMYKAILKRAGIRYSESNFNGRDILTII